VAVYDYRCDDCGCFEQRMPMGTATATVECPNCGGDAKRIFTVPMSYRTPKPLATMLAREEASRDYPQVVDRVPPRGRPRPTPPHPAFARLPRP
jgi:putative FmdB family regulatory protein